MIKPRQTEPYKVPDFILKANVPCETMEPSEKARLRDGVRVQKIEQGESALAKTRACINPSCGMQISLTAKKCNHCKVTVFNKSI